MAALRSTIAPVVPCGPALAQQLADVLEGHWGALGDRSAWLSKLARMDVTCTGHAVDTAMARHSSYPGWLPFASVYLAESDRQVLQTMNDGRRVT